MSDHDHHIDEVSGTKTTGHEWDGIRELNTPLPRWWLITFYASILFAIVYVIFMPAIPGLPGATGASEGVWKQSDRVAVAADLAKLKADRSEQGAKMLNASLAQIESDPELQQVARAMGGSAFGDNCATCHGSGGAGNKGYPSLADDVWLWGGSLEDIRQTLRFGIRSGHAEQRYSEMPAFGRDELLPASDIDLLTEHVLALSGQAHNAAKAAAAAELFAANCASCHGAEGRGDQTQGAPNLTDKEWLYGGGREDIRQQIHSAKAGQMPAWSARLDEATINALAVYVHALGGNQ